MKPLARWFILGVGYWALASSQLSGADFSYFAPGDLIPGSGSGRIDCSVYAPGIRFPLETAPAYANSQVYNPGGSQSSGSQCSPSNYDYPWRDNFCEIRSRSPADTPMCPNLGQGHHQGQDIRASTCVDNSHWVVSATAGTVTHIPTSSTWWVDVTASDGAVYSYLHMSSIQVAVGQGVAKGQRLGRVSNKFGSTPTTIHLHFELRKSISGFGFTPVPPYTSLVQSFRSLTGAISANSRVRASANVNVRNAPAGGSLGIEPLGGMGTVTGASQVANLSGFCWIWWPIRWDDGLEGWSVDNFLAWTSTPPPDSTPPETSITSGPSGTVSTRDVTFTFSGSDNVTPTGSLQFATRLDPLETSFSAFSGQASRSYTGLANGTYTFFVKSRDQAGNQDASPATRSFTVNVITPDSTPPDTSITSGPSGTVSTRDVNFTYTGSDNVTPSGSLQFAYRLDPLEPSFSAFGSQSSPSYTGLANGSYTFFVKARDQAGNQDASPATRSFTVNVVTPDSTPPDTSITSGPSGTVSTRDVNFTYTGSDNVTPSGSLQFATRLDPLEASFSAFGSQASRSYSGLANGTYTFFVKARDQAGNQDPSPASRAFTVSVGTGQRAVSADFDGDGVSDWTIYRNGAWIYFGPCSHPLDRVGGPLSASCTACAGAVCAVDSFCCDTEWDEICVSEVQSFCR